MFTQDAESYAARILEENQPITHSDMLVFAAFPILDLAQLEERRTVTLFSPCQKSSGLGFDPQNRDVLHLFLLFFVPSSNQDKSLLLCNHN